MMADWYVFCYVNLKGPTSSHFCGVTDNKHQDNPAEEGRHGVVPSVGAGDSIVKVGVPIEQNNGWV